MALFDNTMQTGAQAQQLGFAPPTTPANSFTPPGVPVGYGQMQGQPLLSRNPNYGVPTGIASLLGGTNPMGAPQAGAFLAPQQAVPSQMEGINPLTGQAFQTFDATETANIFTQGRVAQEQAAAAAQAEMLRQAQEQAAAEAAASEAAAQAERDRIAAEQAAAAQAEADRIAAEQAAADAAAAEAAAIEAANTKLEPKTAMEVVQSYKDNPESAPGAGGMLGEEQVTRALDLGLFDRDSDFFVDRSGLFGPAGTRYDLPNDMDDNQKVLRDMRQAQTGSVSPTQEEVSAAIRSGIDFGGEGMGSFMPDLRPGSFDLESGTFLPAGPAAAPAAAPVADPAQTASQAAPIAGGSEMGFVPPTQEQINAAIAQMSQVSLAPGEPSLPPLNVPAQPAAVEPEIRLGDSLRGMGGIFANAVAPSDVGYEELAAAAVPTGGSLASGVKGIFAKAAQESENKAQELAAETGMALNDARVVVSQERQRELAQQPAAQESIQRPVPTSPPLIERSQVLPPRPPIMRPPTPPPPQVTPPAPPVISSGGLEGGIGNMIDPAVIANIREQLANLPAVSPTAPPPPMVTPAEARAAATPKPFVAPDLSALMPKPRTQKVTKPKKGRKKVAEPDQKSSKKKRRRRQRGPR